MAEKGKYIYGIIPVQTGDNASSLKAEGLELISHKDIQAVVKDMEIEDSFNMTKEETAKMLVQHQQTIEKIMTFGYSIIPMKLGTFAADDNEIKNILAKGYSLFKNVTDEAAGKIEVDIIALWSDFPAILKEVSEEKEISEFKQKLMADPTKITIEDQKQIGVMIGAALGKKKKDYANKIHKALADVSVHVAPHEVMNDQMLLNTAFMVKKSDVDKFDGMVDKVNAEFEDKLNFRYVGPLPCYSFYTLEVEHIDFDDVGWAKEKLGLNDTADIKEIKKAYKAEAMKLHPDKNIGKSGADDEFDDLNTAYKTLTAYCMTAKGAEGYCSFKEEEVNNNSTIIKLKD
jgi:hypothetical protein